MSPSGPPRADRPGRRRQRAQALCGTACWLLACWAVGASGRIHVTVDARSFQPGELTVFTVRGDTPLDAVRLHAFDRDIPAFATGDGSWRALVGIDLDVAPGSYRVGISAYAGTEPDSTTYSLVVTPKRFPTRTLTVDEAFVNPPATVTERIAREATELNRIWGESAPDRLWRAPFVRPVTQSANSRFGTRSVFNGTPRNPHGGADFLSPAGTPIKAPNDGRVLLARDLYFSGNTVIIDHGAGVFSTLAHLSAFDVREGDSVKRGQVVGKVGATGRVTGPHLHWAVRANGARIDPLSLLALLGR